MGCPIESKLKSIKNKFKLSKLGSTEHKWDLKSLVSKLKSI